MIALKTVSEGKCAARSVNIRPYIYACTPREMQRALAGLSDDAALALDAETIISENNALRIVQLCDQKSSPVILDARKCDLRKLLVPFFRGRKFIIQNAKFDLRVLSSLDVEIPSKDIFDTYIASALLTNTKLPEDRRKALKRRAMRDYSPNKLDSIAKRVLGIILDKTYQDADWGVDLPPRERSHVNYAANDVRICTLSEHQKPSFMEEDGSGYELERDLIPCSMR
jgi:ribonuclease D